jgi:anhydro-N-acetylmuramic acid kinase
MSERYIGLMSGSSLDGVDAVLVSFESASPQLQAHLVHPLEPELVSELEALTRPGTDELARLCRADVLLGECFADAAIRLLDQAGITASQVRAIGSHGQTIRHYPDSHTPTTLQIGDPNIIAERTGLITVADFRRRDMAAGGQGAPLGVGGERVRAAPDDDLPAVRLADVAVDDGRRHHRIEHRPHRFRDHGL